MMNDPTQTVLSMTVARDGSWRLVVDDLPPGPIAPKLIKGIGYAFSVSIGKMTSVKHDPETGRIIVTGTNARIGRIDKGPVADGSPLFA